MRLFIAIEFPKGQKDPFNIKDMWFSVLFIIAIARQGKYTHLHTQVRVSVCECCIEKRKNLRNEVMFFHFYCYV